MPLAFEQLIVVTSLQSLIHRIHAEHLSLAQSRLSHKHCLFLVMAIFLLPVCNNQSNPYLTLNVTVNPRPDSYADVWQGTDSDCSEELVEAIVALARVIGGPAAGITNEEAVEAARFRDDLKIQKCDLARLTCLVAFVRRCWAGCSAGLFTSGRAAVVARTKLPC